MIPRYAEWTSPMIIFLQKNNFFEWGSDQMLKLEKIEKTFCHQQAINNA